MKFILKNDQIIANCIMHIHASMGKTVTIAETKRSNPQNALYWMLLGILAPAIGHKSEDLHEILKVRFIGVEKKIIDGVQIIQPISTTTLNKKQFTEYIDRVYALGHELNVNLPTPDHWGLENEPDKKTA